MNNPTSPKCNNNNNDEEAPPLSSSSAAPPPHLYPQEISFHPPHLHHYNTTFNDDDNTIPSELSTLLAPPSTLTPNYNNDQLHHTTHTHARHAGGGGGVCSHPAIGTQGIDNDSRTSYNKSQRAFQLAALLGMLSIGILFGGDVVYMMVSSSSSSPSDSSQDDNSSTIPTAISMDAYHNVVLGGGDDGVQQQQGGDNNQKKKKLSKTAKKKKKKKHQEEEENDEEGDDDAYLTTGEDTTEEDTDDGVEGYDDKTITITRKQSYSGELIAKDDFANNNHGNNNDDAKKTSAQLTTTVDTVSTDTTIVTIPESYERCPYVIETFEQQNEDITDMEFLHEKYMAQSTSPNVFYRATALLFWKDFARGLWGQQQQQQQQQHDDDGQGGINFANLVLLDIAKYEDGSPLSLKSTWTWVTGDQHLSNFGAWRNRGGGVVFSDNDFDEAAIYDFHMDVLRIVVSICDHGFTNGLDEGQVREALEAFTYMYVKTVIGYVGGDTALLYELTPNTSTGVLRDFLTNVESGRSQMKQVHKFTEIGPDGMRRFVRNDDTRLEDVPPELEAKIRAEITPTRYGASMMKMGFKVTGWDDDFYTVLDVVRRVGSGIGSYGVDRFYVLLKGEDILIEEDEDVLSSSVILDVKYEPKSAVSRILDAEFPETKAWYDLMFRNEADRAAQAQRALTSYTDPFVGYLVIDDDSYIVRQRSPYKSSFDLDTLTNHRAFEEFVEQIAIVTATAHVRGSVAKSPGQFKHVIKLLLAGDRNRKRWSDLVAKIAFSYRNQVLLDFGCFKDYVKTKFPASK